MCALTWKLSDFYLVFYTFRYIPWRCDENFIFTAIFSISTKIWLWKSCWHNWIISISSEVTPWFWKTINYSIVFPSSITMAYVKRKFWEGGSSWIFSPFRLRKYLKKAPAWQVKLKKFIKNATWLIFFNK